VVNAWFKNRRAKAKRDAEKEAAADTDAIENPDETPAQFRLRKMFSIMTMDTVVDSSGTYLLVHMPTLLSGINAKDTDEVLGSVHGAGLFYKMGANARALFHRRHGSLKNDVDMEFRMIQITGYSTSSRLPDYSLGRHGIAVANEEYFICANYKKFNRAFFSVPGGGNKLFCFQIDFLKLSAVHEEKMLELIVEKLYEAKCVEEEIHCNHCFKIFADPSTVYTHPKGCPLLKWAEMSDAEKV